MVLLFQLPFEFVSSFTIIFLIIIAVIVIISISLSVFWVWMLVDCAKRDFKDKLIWILIIIFTHILGATLYYYVIKKPEDKKKAGSYKKT